MNKIVDTIQVLFGIALIIVFVVIIIKTLIIDPFSLSKNYRYTVCNVKKIVYPVEGSPMADYEFRFGESEFNGTSSFYPYKVKIDERFFVKFYVKNPQNCQILFDIPVPDSIIDVPAEGWKELPIEYNSQD